MYQISILYLSFIFIFYIHLLYSLYINLYLNFGVTINRYNRGKSYKENGQSEPPVKRVVCSRAISP